MILRIYYYFCPYQLQEKDMNKISRVDFPFDFLAQYGLEQEMIEDLPESVLATIEAGLFSPLLPVYIRQPFGKTHFRAKFRLERDEYNEIRVIFHFQKSEADFSRYNLTDEQLAALLQGMVVLCSLEEEFENELGEYDTRQMKCFAQLDKETSSVFYVPTPVVARNLSRVSDFYNLTNDDMERIMNGDLVVVSDESGEPITIGIDLLTTTCVRVICCTPQQWPLIVHPEIPTYSFGNDGCWVNKNGELKYVYEQDFTDEINEALVMQSKLNGLLIDVDSEKKETESEQIDKSDDESLKTESSPQLKM